LAPTVCITIDDAIGGRQHLSKITSPVVHAAQRELELKVELLVVEELPRHLPLLTENPSLHRLRAVCTRCNPARQATMIRAV
jgi:hypothetical protein